jgi:hypothetical protein
MFAGGCPSLELTDVVLLRGTLRPRDPVPTIVSDEIFEQRKRKA